jgi:hypothetical protein
MHAFLTGTLGEHGLCRLAKVTDQAVLTIHTLLLDQVRACSNPHCLIGSGNKPVLQLRIFLFCTSLHPF